MDKTIDKKRRSFLKMLFFGGGALFLGKVFDGSTMNLFSSNETGDFKNFKVKENGNKFIVSSKNGQELLIMDGGK